METKKVEGTDKGEVFVYTLSTCGWCRKTKSLLDDLGVAYSYVEVDRTEGADREACLVRLREWNPALSFPTTVINNRRCIIGFKEDDLREALGI